MTTVTTIFLTDPTGPSGEQEANGIAMPFCSHACGKAYVALHEDEIGINAYVGEGEIIEDSVCTNCGKSLDDAPLNAATASA